MHLHIVYIATNPPGNPHCPCDEQVPAGWANGSCALARADGSCIPATYGTRGCRPYDAAEASECTSADAPAWCASSWCWVNSTACERPHEASALAAGRHFSYATCGFLDRYSDTRHAQQLASLPPLRVSFPADSGNGYTVTSVEDGEGVGGTDRGGAAVEFAAATFAAHGIAWAEVPVSAASHAYSPLSTFTACVHAVALNDTDMCWGNFWPTEERRLLADFSSAIYSDVLRLVVPRQARRPSLLLESSMHPCRSKRAVEC
jgi:hypothetical protein